MPVSSNGTAQLAENQSALSSLGVEVIAVPRDADPDALRKLGEGSRILYPVVTDGAEDIVSAYGLVGDSAHAEFLIDRQGYIRAIWRGGADRPPDVAAVQAQVERLNAEKSPPPFPDDHVH